MIVGGASIHDSVWNQFLHAEHWIQLVSGKSIILQTQYTGTSSADFTVDSVALLSLIYREHFSQSEREAMLHGYIILANIHNHMYSAGVPVPQGYHITVTDSFSPVKWCPPYQITGEIGTLGVTFHFVWGYQITVTLAMPAVRAMWTCSSASDLR